jgi:hypothetical protein
MDKPDTPIIDLTIDREKFPLIYSNLEPEQLKKILILRCLQGGLAVTEVTLYSQALIVESELASKVQ